jgi:hypothetical protein
MAEMIVGRPLEKFELRDDHRLQPLALRHLCFGQTLSPPSALRFRQIGERAFVDFEVLEFSE